MTATHTATRELTIATLRAWIAVARVSHRRLPRAERRLRRLRDEAVAASWSQERGGRRS